MKAFLNRALVVLALALLTASVAAGQAPDNNTPLTNAAIVKLVHGGFKEKTIISIVAARPPAYDLSTDRMIELKKSGVSEKVILAMLARQEGMSGLDDTFPDDPFFRDSGKKQKDSQKSGTSDNSTDIFGSSGSGQSSTRNNRGGSASASGDTETTGTATVRIIRPPSEAGGSPKLEKTSPLTNESIIDLVEAGFTDGTIVRRIEQSPVDFDLSPAKTADLRKHRVSDRVLNAMKAANGDDSQRE